MSMTALDVMTTPAITAPEGATLSQLAVLMMKHVVKRIPIMRGRRVFGIVGRSDLVAAMARAPGFTG